MSLGVEPLVVGRVIGDVVDMFVPSVTMTVFFESKQLTNGGSIKPSLAFNPPRINITGHPEQLYTLVMTDPDAPSPSEPYLREWVHWIVTDIPGCTTVAQGKESFPYVGPRPPLGIHRYILVLFQQKSPLGFLQEPATRCNFNTRAFAQQFDLGIPVAVVYFNAQKEPRNKKR